MSDTKNGRGQIHPLSVHHEDMTLVGPNLGQRTPLFILGFFDPEMHTIERCLDIGMSRRAAVRNQLVGAPSEAYRVDDVPLDDAVTGHTVRVWVECRPAGMSREALEARGDIVVDHHAPGDRGFGESRTTHLWSASSLGQVTAVMAAYVAHKRGLVDVLERLCDSSVIVRACVDHNLGETLSGGAVGVHPWSAILAMALDSRATLAHAYEPAPPEAVEAYVTQVIAARAALRERGFVRLAAGVSFVDMTNAGVVPQLPAAASLAGIAYIARAPQRPNTPDTVVVGGLAGPNAVRVFMAYARLAARKLPPEVLAKTPGGDGVYGDPARGFAGTYAPAYELFSVVDAMVSLRDALARQPGARGEIIARIARDYAVGDAPEDIERAVRLVTDAVS